MKKLMVLVLSFGLVLLGTAPVMAAGQTFALSPSAKPAAAVLPVNDIEKIDTGKMKGVEIPEPPGFGMLSDQELEEVEGEGLASAAVGAVVGAVLGAGVAAVHYMLDAAYDNFKHSSVYEYVRTVRNGAIDGAIGGAIAGALAPVLP